MDNSLPKIGDLLRSNLTPPPRSNLSDQVAVILKRFVLAEGLEAGARLPPERELAETFNVSRTVLREAISRLLGEGILKRQSPRVLAVSNFDRASAAASLAPIGELETHFNDLVELRIFLELGAIETISMRAKPEQLKQIEHWVLEGERHLANGEPIHTADVRFHGALLVATGNRIVEMYLPLIEEQIRSLLYFDPQQIMVPVGEGYGYVIKEHREIYEAIAARDSVRAREVLTVHLSRYFHRRTSASPLTPLER